MNQSPMNQSPMNQSILYAWTQAICAWLSQGYQSISLCIFCDVVVTCYLPVGTGWGRPAVRCCGRPSPGTGPAPNTINNQYFTLFQLFCNTAGFMKTIQSVYTLLMNTIYLSHGTQIAEGTLFRKHSVCKLTHSAILGTGTGAVRVRPPSQFTT